MCDFARSRQLIAQLVRSRQAFSSGIANVIKLMCFDLRVQATSLSLWLEQCERDMNFVRIQQPSRPAISSHEMSSPSTRADPSKGLGTRLHSFSRFSKAHIWKCLQRFCSTLLIYIASAVDASFFPRHISVARHPSTTHILSASCDLSWSTANHLSASYNLSWSTANHLSVSHNLSWSTANHLSASHLPHYISTARHPSTTHLLSVSRNLLATHHIVPATRHNNWRTETLWVV